MKAGGWHADVLPLKHACMPGQGCSKLSTQPLAPCHPGHSSWPPSLSPHSDDLADIGFISTHLRTPNAKGAPSQQQLVPFVQLADWALRHAGLGGVRRRREFSWEGGAAQHCRVCASSPPLPIGLPCQ